MGRKRGMLREPEKEGKTEIGGKQRPRGMGTETQRGRDRDGGVHRPQEKRGQRPKERGTET